MFLARDQGLGCGRTTAVSLVLVAIVAGCGSGTDERAGDVPSATASSALTGLTPTPGATASTGATGVVVPADCGSARPAGQEGVLTWKDVWPDADGGGHSEQSTSFVANCQTPDTPSAAPAADCAAGFPWYAASRRAVVLAALGVHGERSTLLTGPAGAQVRETILQFAQVGDPGITKIHELAGQCGTASIRDGIQWVTIDDRTTATTIADNLLIGVEFSGTDLSRQNQIVVVRRATELAAAVD